MQKPEAICGRVMNLPLPSVRIAFIATSYIEQRDGVSVYIENLLAELLQQGHGLAVGIDRIDVIIGQQSLALLSSLLQRQLQRLGCEEEMDRAMFYAVSDTYFGWESWQIPRLLRINGPYDLIVMPNPRPILFAGGRVLTILHDLNGRYMPTWRRFYLELLNTWRLARDEFIGFVSHSTRDAIPKILPMERQKAVDALAQRPSFQSRLGQTPSCKTSGENDRGRLLVMSRGREAQLSQGI